MVDDNTSLVVTLSMILRRRGFDVVTANDGVEGIQRIREKYFDLVLLDIKMPLMNGVETYKRMRQIQPDIKVLMMTAYAVEDLVQEALSEGAMGVIFKPFNIDKISEYITKASETRQGGLILLVDDNVEFLLSLKTILSRRGFTIGLAETGENAIQLASQSKYDIIFIDIVLPTINGFETYLKIKEMNHHPICIMMTAYFSDTQDLIKKALENNAYCVLPKPIDFEKLFQVLESIERDKRREARGDLRTS